MISTIDKMPLDALIELRNDCDIFLQKYALFPQFEKARLALIAVYPSILERIAKMEAEARPQARGLLF